MSRLQQSVGKLMREGGSSLPALARCQAQAAEATGWYKKRGSGRKDMEVEKKDVEKVSATNTE